MSDEIFQSGKWKGHYFYGRRGERHQMELILSFANGLVHGFGMDKLGVFSVTGKFDDKTMEASWTKTYIGKHSVHYRGYRDAMRKSIWGTWQIGDGSKGGFRIWPVGSGADDEAETEIKPEPKPLPAGLSVFVYKRVDPPNVKSNDRFH